MQVTSYLNLNFEGIPFPERVDLAAEAGVDGIEFYGWDLGVDAGPSAGDAFQADVDVGAVADRIHDHGLEFVYLSGNRPPLTDPDRADAAAESIRRSLALADEHGCRYVNVKTGAVQSGYSREAQRQNAVAVLREIASDAEAADATLVLEPLNPLDAADHFIHTAGEGYALLDAVDSPGVGFLFDVYQEQLARGNIVNTLRETAAGYVDHVHVADPPHRGEPGTGELNWETIVGALADAGYDGYIGGEFVPTGDPVAALESLVELGERY